MVAKAVQEKACPEQRMQMLTHAHVTNPTAEITRARMKLTGPTTVQTELSFRLGDPKAEPLTAEHFQQVEGSIIAMIKSVGCDSYAYQHRDKDGKPFFTDEETCVFHEELLRAAGENDNPDVRYKLHGYVQSSSTIMTKIVKAHVNIEAAPYKGALNNSTTDPEDQLLALLNVIQQQRQTVENRNVANKLKEKIKASAASAPAPQLHALRKWLQGLQSHVQQYEGMRVHKEPLDYWDLERSILTSISTKAGQHPHLAHDASAASRIFPRSPDVAGAGFVFNQEQFIHFCADWMDIDAEVIDWAFQKDKDTGSQQRHAGGSVPK
jgi:hypothetical protein